MRNLWHGALVLRVLFLMCLAWYVNYTFSLDVCVANGYTGRSFLRAI